MGARCFMFSSRNYFHERLLPSHTYMVRACVCPFVFTPLNVCVGGRWSRRGEPGVGFKRALRYRGVAVLYGSGLRDEQGLQVSPRQGLRRRAAERGGGAGGVRPLLPFGRVHRQGHDRPALYPDGAGLISCQVVPRHISSSMRSTGA